MISTKPIAEIIVEVLLRDKLPPHLPISEASVHLPKRSRVWVAAYTGPQGGQTWRSTGLTDRNQALLVARKWEADARAERARIGASPRRPGIRVSHRAPVNGSDPLTQREVAALLKISERAVKAIERRALQKLRNHPLLREVWQQFLAGELDEYQSDLIPEELAALFNLVRTNEERAVLHKILAMLDTRIAI